MGLELNQFSFKAMGSPCELKFFCENKNKAQSVADLVIADVQRIEYRYSRYREDSVLSEINRVAELGGQISIDDETAALLNYADTCYQQSSGMFDITSGILRKAWDFKSQKLPKQAELKQLLHSVGWEKISIQNKTLSFSVSGMQLDFGGIGKEYAVDRAATICWQQGIKHGLVNLGGDIKVMGPHPDGKPWRVGLSHPRKPGELLTSLNVYSGAIASSGDYERCMIVKGRRYGHVLNPKTRWPVHGLVSVTVISDQCVLAGSACTIAMLMEKRGKRWLENLGLKYIWVDQKGKVGEG